MREEEQVLEEHVQDYARGEATTPAGDLASALRVVLCELRRNRAHLAQCYKGRLEQQTALKQYRYHLRAVLEALAEDYAAGDVPGLSVRMAKRAAEEFLQPQKKEGARV